MRIVGELRRIRLIGSTGSSGGSQTTPQASSNATLKTTKVPGYGMALATAKGAPVYILTSDPMSGSKCTGACAKDWPPLTVTGKPTGAGASRLDALDLQAH